MTTQSDLLDKADRYIAGAALGMMHLPRDLNPVMVRGQGSRLWDADGKEYIDYLLGSGPMILGHAHPAVVEAVRRQVALGSTYFALNRPVIELAEKLVNAVPCGRKAYGDNAAVRFQTSGSEATFGAMRLARAFTGRPRILKFEGGWHGNSDEGQLSAAPPAPPHFPTPVADSAGIPPSSHQVMLVSQFNDLELTRQIGEAHAHEIAAIIVEPLQRSHLPVPGFLSGLRELATKIGAVLIYDEIVTGFRVAWGGAQEKYGGVPDLATYGKAIAGGYPLSAIVGRRDILSCADASIPREGPPVFLSGTLTGNPIAATAGVATLDELQRPGVLQRLHELGERYKEGVEAIGREFGVPIRVEGDSGVRIVFFERDLESLRRPLRNHRDTLRADKARMVWFGHEQIRNGLYITPGFKTYLSTAHTEDDLDRTFAIMRKILKG
jgi:glutamate-1-semialdehyde 2,1-aminomutase